MSKLKRKRPARLPRLLVREEHILRYRVPRRHGSAGGPRAKLARRGHGLGWSCIALWAAFYIKEFKCFSYDVTYTFTNRNPDI